jgi:hypothetical protein
VRKTILFKRIGPLSVCEESLSRKGAEDAITDEIHRERERSLEQLRTDY